jgi:type VI protein secretion system component VasK
MDEYSGKYAPKKKDPLKPFLPLIGMAILFILGGIAFVLSEPLLQFLQQRVPQALDPRMRWALAAVIFIVGVMIIGLIYSAVTPKGPKGITERELDKQKQERAKEEQAAKRRKAEMQAKMRARNRQNSGDK